MNEINLKRGDLVEVRDHESHAWRTAIYVAFVPNTKYPHFASLNDCPTEEDIQEVIDNSELTDMSAFRFCRKMSSFIPIDIDLNSEYTARVEIDCIYVGCQRFSFEAIDELSKAVLQAKNFIEPE